MVSSSLFKLKSLPQRMLKFGFQFGHTRFSALGSRQAESRAGSLRVTHGGALMHLRSCLACSYLPYCKILVHSLLKTVLLLVSYVVLIITYLPQRRLHTYVQNSPKLFTTIIPEFCALFLKFLDICCQSQCFVRLEKRADRNLL